MRNELQDKLDGLAVEFGVTGVAVENSLLADEGTLCQVGFATKKYGAPTT